jgi:hypothetical protein
MIQCDTCPILKLQDMLVLLKLSIELERPTYLRFPQQLHLHPSEVHTSVILTPLSVV